MGVEDPEAEFPAVWERGLAEGRYDGRVEVGVPNDPDAADPAAVEDDLRRAAMILARLTGCLCKVMWGPAYYYPGDDAADADPDPENWWADAYLMTFAGREGVYRAFPDDPIAWIREAAVPGGYYSLTGDSGAWLYESAVAAAAAHGRAGDPEEWWLAQMLVAIGSEPDQALLR